MQPLPLAGVSSLTSCSHKLSVVEQACLLSLQGSALDISLTITLLLQVHTPGCNRNASAIKSFKPKCSHHSVAFCEMLTSDMLGGNTQKAAQW